MRGIYCHLCAVTKWPWIRRTIEYGRCVGGELVLAKCVCHSCNAKLVKGDTVVAVTACEIGSLPQLWERELVKEHWRMMFVLGEAKLLD